LGSGLTKRGAKMARIVGKTASWLCWIAGLICALAQTVRGQARVLPQPAYGVVPLPPRSMQPGVSAEQMRQAAELVQQYLVPVKATEPAPGLQAKLEGVIRQLGSERYLEREAASAELVKLGPTALGVLRAAAEDRDLEVAARAWSAIAAIETHARQPIVARLKQLGYAAVMAAGQQISAAQSAAAAAEAAASKAEWAGDDERIAQARAAKAAAESRLRLLVRLTGRIALPMNLAYPRYGMATRYGVRPPLPPQLLPRR
jgi:hypothetical protein